MIKLSRAQIAEVLRAADTSGAPSTLLSGVNSADDTAPGVDQMIALATTHERRLSRSLLLGLLVFACFPSDGSLLAVVTIARKLKMSPSAAHRYVQTLRRAQLIEQDSTTRSYRLAPELCVD